MPKSHELAQITTINTAIVKLYDMKSEAKMQNKHIKQNIGGFMQQLTLRAFRLLPTTRSGTKEYGLVPMVAFGN